MMLPGSHLLFLCFWHIMNRLPTLLLYKNIPLLTAHLNRRLTMLQYIRQYMKEIDPGPQKGVDGQNC